MRALTAGQANPPAVHPADCECEDCRRDIVQEWRLRQLQAAGYQLGEAQRIAGDARIDLHYAVELVTEHGCPPGTAAKILL